MTRAAASAAGRAARQAALPFADPVPTAEDVILALAAGYYGQDGNGAGLLVKRRGAMHVARCMQGLWVAEGDSLRGGQPCSDRCQQVATAIRLASAWLKAHDTQQPAADGGAAGQEGMRGGVTRGGDDASEGLPLAPAVPVSIDGATHGRHAPDLQPLRLSEVPGREAVPSVPLRRRPVPLAQRARAASRGGHADGDADGAR